MRLIQDGGGPTATGESPPTAIDAPPENAMYWTAATPDFTQAAPPGGQALARAAGEAKPRRGQGRAYRLARFNSVEIIIILALLSILLAAMLPIFRRTQMTARRGAWQMHENDVLTHPNLIAYYTFSDMKGSLLPNFAQSPEGVPDYDQVLYYGILRGGAAWTNGRWPGKGALFFDGNDDYVDLGSFDVPAADGQNGMSLLVWFKVHDFESTDAPLICKSRAGDDHWSLRTTKIGNAYRLVAELKTYDSTAKMTAETGDLPTDAWMLGAFTFDGNFLRLYLNGALVASQPLVGMLEQDPGALVWIGDVPPSPKTQPFSGLIDEVAIYNRALNATQILEFYQEGKP